MQLVKLNNYWPKLFYWNYFRLTRKCLMTLKLIREGSYTPSALEQKARRFCEEQGLNLTVEWINNQYWLHSDIEKERPVRIDVDQELERHTDYFKKNSVHKEVFARAIGIKGGHRPKVLDLTAGLLGDTLLMLSFGCEVTCIERHPVIGLLVESALAVGEHPALSRLKFKLADAGNYLSTVDIPEVIFFDPMFEDASTKTSPKKEMRIFRSFVGQDLDAEKVFQKARTLNPKRLVVKRPRQSIEMGGTPDVRYEGKATRYDVYFSRNMAESGQIP